MTDLTEADMPWAMGANNPRVKALAGLKRPKERKERGRVLVEGVNLLRDALDAGLSVVTVAVTPGGLADREISRSVRRATELGATEMILVSEQAMERICDVRAPQGVASEVEIPPLRLSRMPWDDQTLVVVCEAVQDPGNVGAIFRTAEAAGASGVVLAGDCADPWGPKALRASAGSVFRVPFDIHPDAVHAVKTLKGRASAAQLSSRAISTGAALGASVFETDLTGPLIVLAGNEGSGLSNAALKAADRAVSVPILGRCESLNVGAALCVVLYEAARQRNRLSGARGYPF